MPGWGAEKYSFNALKECGKRSKKRAKKRVKFLSGRPVYVRRKFPEVLEKKRPVIPVDVDRVLTVNPDSANPVLSRWARRHGSWSCVAADEPYGWFMRLAHIERAGEYLTRHRIPFLWGKPTPPRAANRNRGKDSPAEADTPKEASVPPGSNTAALLNNDPPFSRSDCGLERNGVTTSSPLNAQARA